MMEECEKKKTAAFVESYCGASAAKAQGSPPPAAEVYPSSRLESRGVRKTVNLGDVKADI